VLGESNLFLSASMAGGGESTAHPLKRRVMIQEARSPSVAPPLSAGPAPAPPALRQRRGRTGEPAADRNALDAALSEVRALRTAYDELYESAPVGYVSLDSQGVILKLNTYAARLLAASATASPAELLNRPLGQLVAAESLPGWVRFLAAAWKATGRVAPEQLQLRDPRLDPVHVQLDARAATAEGKARTVRLVMDRVRSAERGLTWQVSPDLLGVLTRKGVFERTNPAWQTVLGWTEAELASMPVYRLLHPEDRNRTQAAFRRLGRGQPVLRFENRYRARTGEYRWLSWVAVPEDGLFYCSARDITEEKDRAQLLATRSAGYDRVWRNSRSLLIILSADGIFKAVNPAWNQLLGLDPEQAIGRSFTEFVWPEDLPASLGALETANARIDLIDFENRYRHKDGTPRWISWSTAVEGDLIYGYGRDVTSQKEAQAELAKAQEALRQAQKMEAVGQLTGGIAHDFNNMLAGVMGNLEMLRMRLGAGQIEGLARYVDEAMSAAHRAAALTHRLLAFSRRQTLDPKAVSINELIGSMHELLKRTLGPGIALATDLGPDLWTGLCDPHQLESTLLNLAINSRDAMPSGGTLLIRTLNVSFGSDRPHDHVQREIPDIANGAYVCITVTDTGVGMPPDVLTRAFDPFFTTKPIGQGTGLGLSMVYGFVTQSHGHIRMNSSPGRGTTVTIYLPMHDGVAAASPSTLPPNHALAPGQRHVLLVEDEVSIRRVGAEFLTEFGYTVHEAGDAREGLALFNRLGRVDLLITDVGLPDGMNGRQLADAVRCLQPELKVLFITGFAEHSALRGGMLGVGMHVLAKPFTLDSFIDKVHELARPAEA
jgi:PAS domain S-box-containing protein